MVLAVNPVSEALKLPEARFDEATVVPLPLANPLVVLYSNPYPVTELHPLAVIEPVTVAEVLITEAALPVVTRGALLIPAPVTETWIAVDVPPLPTLTGFLMTSIRALPILLPQLLILFLVRVMMWRASGLILLHWVELNPPPPPPPFPEQTLSVSEGYCFARITQQILLL